MSLLVSMNLFAFGTLNFNLSRPYDFISSCLTYNEDYLTNWFTLFAQSIKDSIPIKRSKRRLFPDFYSSQLMHLIYMRNTSLKKLSKFWSLRESLKMKQLSINLDHAIEVDKLAFINGSTFVYKSKCFSLLRSLKSFNNIPNLMYGGNKSVQGPQATAELFNEYFCSV